MPIHLFASPCREVQDELDAGPDAVSPRDFVDNTDVLTVDEYEKRKAQVKA